MSSPAAISLSALNAVEAPSLGALQHLSLPCALLDADMRFVAVNPFYAQMVDRAAEALIGQRILDIFPETEDRMAMVKAKFSQCLTGETARLDDLSYKIEMEDGAVLEKVWRIVNDPVCDTSGRVTHVLQRAEDITDDAALARRNEAIHREINHRAKNTMAVVTAIARISARNADDFDTFLKGFTGRIDAMRRTHDRLNHDAWLGLSLRETFETEMRPFAEETGATYTLDGPNLNLSVTGTKDLALVVHELLTNAVKYGCYKSEGGQLDISWAYGGEGVEISWSESCAHKINPGEAKGFGSRLFKMLPHVSVKQDFRESGLHATICLSGPDAFA